MRLLRSPPSCAGACLVVGHCISLAWLALRAQVASAVKGTRVSCFRFRFASRASAPSITLHRVQLFYALPLLGAEWLARWHRSSSKFPAGLPESERAAFEHRIAALPQFSTQQD